MHVEYPTDQPVQEHFDSNAERATESPAAVVRLGAIVIKEDTTESTITKERAAEFSHLRRRFHPA